MHENGKPRLYWTFIIQNDILGATYVATEKKLDIGTRIQFIDTLGYIYRIKKGSWSCFDKFGKFLNNEPGKKSAMKAIRNNLLKTKLEFVNA